MGKDEKKKRGRRDSSDSSGSEDDRCASRKGGDGVRFTGGADRVEFGGRRDKKVSKSKHTETREEKMARRLKKKALKRQKEEQRKTICGYTDGSVLCFAFTCYVAGWRATLFAVRRPAACGACAVQ